jgi:hypothetical protein
MARTGGEDLADGEDMIFAWAPGEEYISACKKGGWGEGENG